MSRVLAMLAAGVLLAACGSNPPAPLEQRYGGDRKVRAETEKRPDQYTVVRGDTLFSIAWRYGLDFRSVARANRVSSPYTIFPGQVLQLKEAPVVVNTPSRQSTSSSASSGTSSRPVSKAATVPAATAAPPKVSAKPAVATAIQWRWPTSGKVVRGFSGTVHKGIDIDGKAGDTVKAVAAGKVVYAGSGIVGYGKLLIVKHNEIYLSAYGHNRKLLVREGQQIAAGQRIAEKGSSATNSVKLHFEIRREGKPVDPVKLLPGR